MPLGIESRYYDRPMPGSIYTAPDILNVVRGPTLVRLRDRKEPIRVPAMMKANAAPANTHDHADGDEKTMLLRRILAGVDPYYKKNHDKPSEMCARRIQERHNVMPRTQPIRQ